MLLAKNAAGKIVEATRLTDRQANYICPMCEQEVFLKRGELKVPHFAHFKKCLVNCFTEGETQAHLTGKQKLKELFERLGYTVQLEAYLPKLQQRPDVLAISKSKKQYLAIEYQCSLISAEQLAGRTQGYLQAGYFPLWLFGEKYYNKRTLTPTLIAGLLPLGHTFGNLFLLKDKLLIKYDWQQLGYPHQLYYALWERKLSKIKELPILRHKAHMLQVDFVAVHHFLKQQSYYKTSFYASFFQALYEDQDHLMRLPVEIYAPLKNEWRLVCNPFLFRYQLLKIIENFSPQSPFSIKILEELLPSHLKTYFPSPQLKPPLQPLVLEFLKRLTTSQVIEQRSPQWWQFKQPAQRAKRFIEKW